MILGGKSQNLSRHTWHSVVVTWASSHTLEWKAESKREGGVRKQGQMALWGATYQEGSSVHFKCFWTLYKPVQSTLKGVLPRITDVKRVYKGCHVVCLQMVELRSENEQNSEKEKNQLFCKLLHVLLGEVSKSTVSLSILMEKRVHEPVN